MRAALAPGGLWRRMGRLERCGRRPSGVSDTVGVMDTTDAGTTDTKDTTDIKAITLRIPDDLRRRIRVLAASEDKTSNQWMQEALELVVRKSEERRDAR